MKLFTEYSPQLQEQIARQVHAQAKPATSFSPTWGEALRALNPAIPSNPTFDADTVKWAAAIAEAMTKLTEATSADNTIRIPANGFVVEFNRASADSPWHYAHLNYFPDTPTLTVTIERVHIDGKWAEFWFKEKHLFPGKSGYHLSAKVGVLGWAINDADLINTVYTTGLRGQKLKWQLMGINYEILGFEKPAPTDMGPEPVRAFLATLGEPGTPEYAEKAQRFLDDFRAEVLREKGIPLS